MKRLLISAALLCACPVWGAISFVNSSSGVVAAGTGTGTVTMPASMAQDDFVIVQCASDSALNADGIETGQGYTDIQHNTDAEPGNHSAYKFMGATPDTTVTILQEAIRATVCTITAYRGVDLTTPLDGVAITTTNSTAAGDPDNGSIAAGSAGSWIVITAAIDDDNGATTTVPSGYSNDVNGQTGGAGNASATSVQASQALAATDDPAAWDLTSSDHWTAHTIRLKAAAAGGGPRRRVNIIIGGL